MEWANAYLGQRGLASKYLAEEIDPKCDPLGPDNKLIMATGPLTGTTAATGGRYSVVTKSPLTNLIACSNSGGFIGAEMKFAGWDMIIFEGKAESPVYLNVVNDKAELLSAADIWGKSVWDADKILHAKHQDLNARRLRWSCRIAGNLYAAVVNVCRAAGRSGVGTVMASKNLKAVCVRGNGGVSADMLDAPADFMGAVAAGKQSSQRTR